VKKYISGLYRLGTALITDPYAFAKVMNTVPYICSAYGLYAPIFFINAYKIHYAVHVKY
jgi:hypothetical protein